MFFVDRSNESNPFSNLTGKESINSRPNVRAHIAEVFKNNCAYCGCKVDLNTGAEIDHFIPRAREGDFGMPVIHCCSNLVLSCGLCNGGLHGKHAKYPVLNPCDALESVSDNPDTVLAYEMVKGCFYLRKNPTDDICNKFKSSELYINRQGYMDKRMDVYSKMHISIRKLGAMTQDDAAGWDEWDQPHRISYIEEAKLQDYVVISHLQLERQKLIDCYVNEIKTAIKDGSSFHEFLGVKRHLIRERIEDVKRSNPTLATILETLLKQLGL